MGAFQNTEEAVPPRSPGEPTAAPAALPSVPGPCLARGQRLALRQRTEHIFTKGAVAVLNHENLAI